MRRASSVNEHGQSAQARSGIFPTTAQRRTVAQSPTYWLVPRLTLISVLEHLFDFRHLFQPPQPDMTPEEIDRMAMLADSQAVLGDARAAYAQFLKEMAARRPEGDDEHLIAGRLG